MSALAVAMTRSLITDPLALYDDATAALPERERTRTERMTRRVAVDSIVI